MTKNKAIIEILLCSALWSIAGILMKQIPWSGFVIASFRSLIAGTVMVVYLEQFSKGNLFGMHISQPIIPGLVAGFVFFVLFSYLMPPAKRTTDLVAEEDI